MCLIDRRRPLGLLGRFIAMSTAELGSAGLGGRRSGNGRIIRGAALGWGMTTTVGDIFQDRSNSARRKKRRFGGAFGGVLGGRFGQGGVSRALSAKIAIKQRGGLQGPRLGSPIPSGGQAAVVSRVNRISKIANHPGAMVLPQLYSVGFAPGMLAGHVAGGNCYMGWYGAAWAIAHLGPLGPVSLLPALVGPGAGAQGAH